MRPAVANMKRMSKYKLKAYQQGLIRPFLYLVSMSPKRRAALAELMGLHLTRVTWYLSRDAHRETWYVIKGGRKSLQARSNSSSRTINPLSHGSNWYMILVSCAKRVKNSQRKFIPKDVRALLKGKEKSYSCTIACCQNPKNPTLLALEEIVLLIFFSLTDADVNEEQQKEIHNKNWRLYLSLIIQGIQFILTQEEVYN